MRIGVERRWRVVEGPSGRVVICAIFERPSATLELRIGYSGKELLQSELMTDLESARARAEQWLRVFRDAGGLACLAKNS